MKLPYSITAMMLLAAMQANAAQIKIASDNTEVIGKISQDEVNRVSLVHDRVAGVHTNQGSYEFINDEESGDVYIRALPDNYGAPFNGFLTTEKGYSYKLLLTPIDVPSEQLFIKNPALVQADTPKHDKPILAYKQELIALITAMKQEALLSEYTVDSVHKRRPLNIKGLRMVQKVRYSGAQYHGGIFTLRNRSDEPISVQEQDFAEAGVRAVTLSATEIAPDASIQVYIVEDSK